jgi:hypothetical protein
MKLRQIFESPRKVAVAAFGRMNPPTIGHEKLVDKIKSIDGDHFVFLSQTQKPKTDPLPFDAKLEFAKKFFPDVNVGHASVRTPIQMLQMLEKLGYTDVVYVAGSDRVESFTKLFNDYNGKEYNFESIQVVSAGERDPDADGAEGMSASKMRAAAASGDYESFAMGTPDAKLAQKMYDAVRKGMGVKDTEPAEGVAEGLNEFAPDGFNGGDGDEFSPEIAKMAQEDGFTKGASLADGATLERAITINDWHNQHGGMYKQYFAKGFISGRKEKIRHDNKQYNLNLKLMKDGSIRHGEQGVAEGSEEQVYKVVALDKSNALKKPTKLNVKASSIEDVFSRLAANDWYALSINGVEVVAGKRLKQGVAEVSQQTLQSYRKKAAKQKSDALDVTDRPDTDDATWVKNINIASKRKDGIAAANKRLGVEEASDISGLMTAAGMVQDYIITAEVDGKVKKFRVRGMTGPRAAKERFLKHASMAKVLDVKAIDESQGISKSKEDKFHSELDKLVHKTFGHSPDEKKEKKSKKVDELSSELLGKYKKAASADATAADAKGNYKHGDKRYSGIIKATKKQFANDAKVKEGWGDVEFEVDGWKYRAEEEDEGDVRKMYHSATGPDGKNVDIDYSPYEAMTPELFKLWVKLGMPKRQGSGPLNKQVLMKMAQSGVKEASYEGNIGIMELFKFFNKAEKEDPKLVARVKEMIKQRRDKEVWRIIQDYTGTQLTGKEFEGSIKEAIFREADYGKYWCSTDKKWKFRKGPKQSRGS